MRVLMTGMSARSVGSKKIHYDYISLSDIFHRALEELGHDVDRRVVEISEDDTLDEYDRGLVLVNWASSLSSMHVHEAGLALARLARGNRAILYIDDWRTESLGDDLDHHVLRNNGWDHHTTGFRKDLYAKLTGAQTAAVRFELLKLIEPNDGTRIPMIGPFHPWGDPQMHLNVSKVPLRVRMLPIDPSPAVFTPEGVIGSNLARMRQWVLATLQNHDRWSNKLGNGWPIFQLGGVKKSGGGLHANIKSVVPEAVVVQAYADNWGSLVAPYKNEGSGWWRPRYTYALSMGGVVHIGSALDAGLIGSSFTNSIEDIEAADDADLRELSLRQREEFERYQPTYENFLKRLDTYVTRGF